MRPPLLFAALSAVLLNSCFSPGDGQAPPLDTVYFPTGLALDDIPGQSPAEEPPKYLYVASSDFDLQYRASALASYDLNALQKYLPASCNADSDCSGGKVCDVASANPSYFCVDPSDTNKPCGSLGEHSAADQVLYPGRCASIDPHVATDLISDAVRIGAFATDVIFKVPGLDSSNNPVAVGPDNPEGRLFLPVRGDATLHWIDVDDQGRFHCGQSNTPDQSCDDVHRIGDDIYTESTNDLRQPAEPFAIAADDAGNNIAITNQTTGSVSLFVNHWSTQTLESLDSAAASAAPSLEYILNGLPSAPIGIAALPTPTLPPNTPYESGFLVVYRDAPQVDLLRVHADPASASPYSVRVLTRAASVAINANSVGSDSRGIVIDDFARQADYKACEQPCAGLTDAALTACEGQLGPCLQAVHQPSVFVSNRAPASLLVGALTADFSYAAGTSELPAFTDSVPLTLGPSRVVLGRVKVPSSAPDALSDAAGTYALEPRVFVVCFDSRRIYLYDPVRRVIDSIVTTGRGPFALAIDELRGLGYVAHFTDSYLGVISLDQRFPQNYAAIVASVGVPSPPRASK